MAWLYSTLEGYAADIRGRAERLVNVFLLLMLVGSGIVRFCLNLSLIGICWHQ